MKFFRLLRQDERRRRHPRARPDHPSRRLRRDLCVRRAARPVALEEGGHPGLVTTEWLKKKRSGVLVDHRQNGWGKTIASVYWVRAKPGRTGLDAACLGRADRAALDRATFTMARRARAGRTARRSLRARARRRASRSPRRSASCRRRATSARAAPRRSRRARRPGGDGDGGALPAAGRLHGRGQQGPGILAGCGGPR